MKMNRVKIKRLANLIASFAMVFSFVAANSRCVCIFHQPVMPDELKKLKKM